MRKWFRGALVAGAVAAVLAAAVLVGGVVTGTVWADPPQPQAGWYGGHLMGGLATGRVAELLGITPQELAEKLSAGETLAAIAEGKGVSSDQVVATILEPFQDQLALRVKYSYLTQEQADELLAQRKALVEEAIATGTGAPYGNADFCPMHTADMDYMHSGGVHNGFGTGGSLGSGQSTTSGWQQFSRGFGGMMGGMGGFGGGMMGGWSR